MSVTHVSDLFAHTSKYVTSTVQYSTVTNIVTMSHGFHFLLSVFFFYYFPSLGLNTFYLPEINALIVDNVHHGIAL